MRKLNLAAALLLALPVSTFVVGCGGDEDSEARAALEREALQRELDLALQPDTMLEPELVDVPLEEPESPAAPPRTAPAPAPRPAARTQRPAPRPSAPSPAPEPSPEPSRPRTVTMPVPSGTTFAVRMNQELSTRSTSQGETFTATLSEPLLSADGTTLIPAGATLRGRVTEARKSGRAGEQAQLRVDFTSLSYGGETYGIEATTLEAEGAKLVTRDSKASQAAKIGGGAVVGGVLGRVIGKSTKGTVAGAAIGAAAGTAVAMGTADVDAVIPAGSRVHIRLDSPVRVTKEL